MSTALSASPTADSMSVAPPLFLAPGSIAVEERETLAPFRPTCGSGKLKQLVASLPTLSFDTEADAEAAIAVQLRDESCAYIPTSWSAGDIMTKLWLRKCISIENGKYTIAIPGDS